MKSKIKGPDGKGELFGRGAGEVDLGESSKGAMLEAETPGALEL